MTEERGGPSNRGPSSGPSHASTVERGEPPQIRGSSPHLPPSSAEAASVTPSSNPSSDKTEEIVRSTLEKLWPELDVETEAHEPLVILPARPASMPHHQRPELRLAWFRGEENVVASVHPVPSAGRWNGTIQVPRGDPRSVTEAGVRDLRAATPPTLQG